MTQTTRTHLRIAVTLGLAVMATGCCCDQSKLPSSVSGDVGETPPGAEGGPLTAPATSPADGGDGISTEVVHVPGPAPILADAARGRAPLAVVAALRDLQSVLTRPDSDVDIARFTDLGWTPGWDPSRVGLDGVSDRGGTVRVEGWAQTSNDVVEFTRRLRSSERFAGVELGGTVQSAGATTQDWTLTARLVVPAQTGAAEPAGMDVAELLSGFYHRANLAGISVTGVKPGDQVDRLGFRERRLDLTLEGGYVGTVAFFESLPEVDPGLRIGDFALVRGPGERRGGGMLEGTVTLFAYAAP